MAKSIKTQNRILFMCNLLGRVSFPVSLGSRMWARQGNRNVARPLEERDLYAVTDFEECSLGEAWRRSPMQRPIDGPCRFRDLNRDRKSTRLNSSHLGISY